MREREKKRERDRQTDRERGLEFNVNSIMENYLFMITQFHDENIKKEV